MKIEKEMSNAEIYYAAEDLIDGFAENVSLPVKAGFYLYKNRAKIIELATEIDQERTKILEKYGKLIEGENRYEFEGQNGLLANTGITELMALKQSVPLYMLNLDWFGDMKLTAAQIRAMSCMVDEEDDHD